MWIGLLNTDELQRRKERVELASMFMWTVATCLLSFSAGILSGIVLGN